MRLLHLPSSYFPDSLGGTETYVAELIGDLRALGHESVVAVHGPAPRRFEHAGHEVRVLPPFAARRRSEVLMRRVRGHEAPGFAALLDEVKPDAAHFHAFTLGAGLAHAAALKSRGIPYLVTFHVPAMTCVQGELLRAGKPCEGRMDPHACAVCLLERLGVPRVGAGLLAASPLPWSLLGDTPAASRLAAPSLLRSVFGAWHGFFADAAGLVSCAAWHRDVLLRNGLDPTKIAVSRQGLRGPSRARPLRLPIVRKGPLALGFFGRLTPEKGLETLAAAMPLLRARLGDVRCEAVGPPSDDAAYAGKLRATLDRVGIVALPPRSGADLARWVAGRDLIVVPSRHLETGPLVVLEAWDQGVPVIGSDAAGIRETLAAEGLEDGLFTPADPAALAAAVERLCAWSRPAPVVRIRGMAAVAAEMVTQYERARRP